MKYCIILFLSLLLVHHAGAEKTLEQIVEQCNDCHGENGVSQESDIPTIAGFSAITISDMLFTFQEENRPAKTVKYRHGDTSRAETNMIEIAKTLSEEDIEALAEHYSGLSFTAAKQPFDAALVEKGKEIHEKSCRKCHIHGGSDPSEDASIIAGQWTPYLRDAFDTVREGKRPIAKKMDRAVKQLSDEDIEALLNYYASQQ